MHSVGICGSDVHYLRDGKLANFVVEGPMVLGHESSGTVVEVGPGVSHLKLGDRVAIEPGVPCRSCRLCKLGKYNLCPDVEFCATPPVDGTLTRYYRHAADFCFKLPDHVSYEEGALLEPLSVAVHACRRGAVSAGHYVLISGAGPIGLVNSLVARAMGAASVCIVEDLCLESFTRFGGDIIDIEDVPMFTIYVNGADICKEKLEFAKKLGIQHTVLVAPGDQPEDTTAKVLAALGRNPDVSIECCGAPSSVTLCLKMCYKLSAMFSCIIFSFSLPAILSPSCVLQATISGGCAVLVGAGPKLQNLPVVEATMREVDVRGVLRYANCYQTALDLVASGAVDVKPLVTHRFKLEQAKDAFEAAKSGAGVKIMIKCAN
ncbi:SORD [Cordylochernes scorpioides]|uniref:Sorbitol dehydrogenase n=1 Tax=Cordylochernes scorpioides TaxID=51811 RepID=A0ABY6KJJ9_9ARAC|nr:SORD [Cordylochernes scorpioides]